MMSILSSLLAFIACWRLFCFLFLLMGRLQALLGSHQWELVQLLLLLLCVLKLILKGNAQIG